MRWNSLIVLATVALVLVPLCFGRFENELANWHLAAAANALQFGDDPDEVEKHLLRARQTGSNLEKLRDYWPVRVMQALTKDPSKAPEIVRQALEANVDFQSIAEYAFDRLRVGKEYALAIQVRESSLTESQRTEPDALNELSYFRSLAAVDLDRALQDINRALDELPEDGTLRDIAYRDTRAWVLFQMGRTVDALSDADYSVNQLQELKEQQVSDPVSRLTRYLESSQTSKGDAGAGERTLSEHEADPQIWDEGVLRYHRASILDALGRDTDAQQDWKWLKEHQLPLDGRLQ